MVHYKKQFCLEKKHAGISNQLHRNVQFIGRIVFTLLILNWEKKWISSSIAKKDIAFSFILYNTVEKLFMQTNVSNLDWVVRRHKKMLKCWCDIFWKQVFDFVSKIPHGFKGWSICSISKWIKQKQMKESENCELIVVFLLFLFILLSNHVFFLSKMLNLFVPVCVTIYTPVLLEQPLLD